jgi:hypothetical protein
MQTQQMSEHSMKMGWGRFAAMIEDIERKGARGNTPLPAIPAVVTPEMEPKIRQAVR